MLRLFSALILMLGTIALAGCQSTNAAAPETAQPAAQKMEVNHEMCCKHRDTCDRACRHECKMNGIHCEHHKSCNKHHHHKAKKSQKTAENETSNTTQQTTGSSTETTQTGTTEQTTPGQ